MSVPSGRRTTRAWKNLHCLRPLRLQVFLRLRLHCPTVLTVVGMVHGNASAGTGTGAPGLAILATNSMTCRVIVVTENASRRVAGVEVRLSPWRSLRKFLQYGALETALRYRSVN